MLLHIYIYIYYMLLYYIIDKLLYIYIYIYYNTIIGSRRERRNRVGAAQVLVGGTFVIVVVLVII